MKREPMGEAELSKFRVKPAAPKTEPKNQDNKHRIGEGPIVAKARDFSINDPVVHLTEPQLLKIGELAKLFGYQGNFNPRYNLGASEGKQFAVAMEAVETLIRYARANRGISWDIVRNPHN